MSIEAELVSMARKIIVARDIDWPDEYTFDHSTPAEIFLGRWFMSKKPKDSKLYKSLARAYPYRGKAYRQDGWVPYGGKYASWSRTEKGLKAWKEQAGDGVQYVGMITKGIDMTKLIKGEGLEGDFAAKLIMKVEEVVPIERVKDIEQIWPFPGPVDRIARIAGRIVSLNCKDFEDDYVTLLKQYHTMSGPGKRPMKKTLDVMERRLRDECQEDKVEKRGKYTILYGKEAQNPDKLYSNSSARAFVYYPKTKKTMDINGTHRSLFQDYDKFEELDSATRGEAFKVAMAWLKKFAPGFIESVDIEKNWKEFTWQCLDEIPNYSDSKDYGDFQRGVWGGVNEGAYIGRWSDGAISLWNRVSVSEMEKVAKNLSMKVHTIHAWMQTAKSRTAEKLMKGLLYVPHGVVRNRKKVEDAIEEIEAAMEGEQIRKPDWQILNTTLSIALEESSDNVMQEIEEGAARRKGQAPRIDLPRELWQVVPALKKIRRHSGFGRRILDDWADGWTRLHMVMKRMKKEMMVSGRPKRASRVLRLYHGTSAVNARKIKSSGLKADKSLGPRWYVFSDHIDDAIFHSKNKMGNPVVMVFEVPVGDGHWEGDPYLWPSSGARSPGGTFKGSWYAPMDDIPSKFLKRVIKVSEKDLRRVTGGRTKRAALPSVKTLENLKGSDTIEVMHGTSGQEMSKMFTGVDATSEHYRVYNGPRHSGLFVTTDHYTARKFGKIILKFKAKAKSLHGVDWSGNVYKPREFESKYPNSFNPSLSYTLLSDSEPQALFKGKVSPKDIVAIEIDKKWYKLEDAREALEKQGYIVSGIPSIDSTDGSIGIKQYFELLLQDKDTLENSIKELEEAFEGAYKFGGEEAVKKYLSDDFKGSALDRMTKKMIKKVSEKDLRRATAGRHILSGSFDAPPRVVGEIGNWVSKSVVKMKKSGRRKMVRRFSFGLNDLRGWKYEKLFLGAPKSNRIKAINLYGTITVILQEETPTMELAEWNAKKSAIIFYGQDGDMEGKLIHELRHWSQRFLSEATGHMIGFPSKKMRNPGVTQQGLNYGRTLPKGQTSYSLGDSQVWLKNKKKELKDHHITKMSQVHSLDDSEFYTIMGDIVRRMKKALSERTDLSGRERNNVLRELLSADGELDDIKKFSRAKWIKMVKEVLKQVG